MDICQVATDDFYGRNRALRAGLSKLPYALQVPRLGSTANSRLVTKHLVNRARSTSSRLKKQRENSS